MNFLTRKARTAAAMALLWAATAVAAAPLPSTTSVAGTKLSLNGEGTRYKAIFQVYDLGLYLPKPARTSAELLRIDGPMKLAFVAKRDLPGTDLGVAFMKGLAANNEKALVSKHLTSTNRLIEVFSGRAKLVEDDTFAMEYLPGKGTQFYIAGEPQGAPIGDLEFFRMVLNIWVGPSPADFRLKEKLLSGNGAAPASPEPQQQPKAIY
ncbi:chalcone isomerase family protein [Hydrogenophaga sp. 5NK40-0174]|uniref:chalcone isomerase family protein n=1 Tax=Hydrogenophaga sp. 5NK40-0174 TaxID=3127649 RepID=UPI00333EC369